MHRVVRSLKYWGEKFLVDSPLGRCIVLFLTPFLLKPSQFAKSNPNNSLYRKLGFLVPITPAWLFSLAATYTVRAFMDSGIFGIVESSRTEIANFERMLPLQSAIFSYIAIPLAVYIFSISNWLIHELTCFVIRKVYTEVRNVDFRFYLVKWCGRAVWLSVMMLGMGVATSYADALVNGGEFLTVFAEKHSVLFTILVLTMVVIYSCIDKRRANNMLAVYGNWKIYRVVLGLQLVLGLGFLIAFPKIFAMLIILSR